jgi:hypothetical protein
MILLHYRVTPGLDDAYQRPAPVEPPLTTVPLEPCDCDQASDQPAPTVAA